MADTVLVVCDLCNRDYTQSEVSGGFLFGDKAVCPECAPEFERKVHEYNEAQYIKARCPADMSFYDWVVQVLGGGFRSGATLYSVPKT